MRRPAPRARPRGRSCPPARRSSARRRGRCARPARARRGPSRPTRGGGSAGSGRGRARERRPQGTPCVSTVPPGHFLSDPNGWSNPPCPMDPRDDDDIQFDFFEDEPATTEAQSSRVRLPRRGGRGRPPSGPHRSLTPLLRLLGAVVVLVVLLVLFGLAIQSCAGTSAHDEYASYMSDAAKIAHSSQEDGSAVANALTSGAKP